jgi:hypothetical protein
MSVRSRVDLWRDLHEWPETPLLRVASTAPLDALAFRLETLDEAGEFNANLPVFDDWEMALRLRSIREFTPLDSEIEMRTTLSFPDRDIPYAAAAGVARLIHGAYPDRDDAEAALRRQLIVDLELMAAQAANPEHASRALPDFYRTAAGTRIRLRTVHA